MSAQSALSQSFHDSVKDSEWQFWTVFHSKYPNIFVAQLSPYWLSFYPVSSLLKQRYRISNVCSLTYLWTWALPEKLPIVQPFRKFPAILRNPKVHHHVHKSPPLVPIMTQFDPVPTIPSYLSKIHFNIVHPPTSWSS
jgi:hypothetical protein